MVSKIFRLGDCKVTNDCCHSNLMKNPNLWLRCVDRRTTLTMKDNVESYSIF